MRVLVINLAAATDRMAFQQRQAERLGLDLERLEAVTPATLSPPAEDPVWHRWQRPLRVTEMALTASHIRAWHRVILLAAPCLVLEDDALLAPETPDVIERLTLRSDVDYVTLETRSRRKLVSRQAMPDLPIRRLHQDRTGSAAYVVFPRGAQMLIAHAARAGAPSDALISSAYGLRAYQADPALAIQLDQCAAYGVRQPIPTRSSIDAVAKPPAAGDRALAYRIRRIGAQIRMGWRQLVHIGRAERRFILPADSLRTDEGQQNR